MGAIYNNAHRVVVWLGIETDNSDLAVNTLRSTAQDVNLVGKITDIIRILVSQLSYLRLIQRSRKQKRQIGSQYGISSTEHGSPDYGSSRKSDQPLSTILAIGFCTLLWQSFKAAVGWIWDQISKGSPISEVIDTRVLKHIGDRFLDDERKGHRSTIH